MTLTRILRLLAPALLLTIAGVASAQDNWLPSDNRWQPFGPTKFEHDFQPFDFRDATIDDYGGRDQWTQGIFASVERLNWNVSRPDRATLGDTNTMFVTSLDGTREAIPSVDGLGYIAQRSTLDHTVRSAPFTWGNRYELGYWDGKTGWMGSVTDLNDQLQYYMENDVAVNFINPNINDVYFRAGIPIPADVIITHLSGFVDLDDDGIDDDLNNNNTGGRFIDTDGDGVGDTLASTQEVDYGDLVVFPTLFREIQVTNHTENASVELMKMFRFRPLHNTTVLEMFLGARYMEFKDNLFVKGFGGFTAPDETFGTTPDTTSAIPRNLRVDLESFWDTQAHNNIIGPQIGGRWYSKRGPWNFIVEGRFFAGFNFQNIQQRGQLAGNLTPGIHNVGNTNNPTFVLNQGSPLAMDNANFEHSERYEEFSPAAELRLETAYQLTKAVSFKMGYTGYYMAGIARADNMIIYQLPHLGISDRNREEVWVNGLNFGVLVNR